MQRTFRDEFYTRPLPTRVGEIQAELEDYLAYYNGHRPHMALEFLAKLQAESVPQESQMC
jgi:transposase InsO family protein